MKPLRLTGVGLRTPHYAEFLEKKPPVAFLEVHSENYFGEGGKPLSILERIRQDYPISLHGVSLSLGSADDLNWQHLRKLRELTERINPSLISEHLSWSSINGHYLHDLLPLPFTEEAIQHLTTRIQQVQEYLGRQILIENISSYIQFPHSTMTEHEFLISIARKSGCGILLDINNIHVSATNHNTDPLNFLYAIPADLVQEIHLAGFTTSEIDGKQVLIDSHNRPVLPAVWELYKNAILHLGVKPTLIEWDSDIPPFETLYFDANRAETIMRETYAAAKRTG